MDFAAARKVMVDSQVRVNDVTDRGLQAALLAVPRERFLPQERAWSAYAEIEPEIVGDRRLMLPRDLSKLLMALGARPGETALAIAGPYAGAVLAELGLDVTAQESDAAVFEVVGEVLAQAGVKTVAAPLNTPSGDGYDVIICEGAVAAPLNTPSGDGYDVIICEGAVPGRPEAWLKALNVGGRLAVVERTGPVGRAVLYVRGEQGVSRRELFNAAPPMLAELSSEPIFAL